MKIAICDDIMEERTRIQNYCKNLGYTDLTLYSCGEDFLNSPEISTVNLVFLDIEMNKVNGIEVKNTLERTNPSTFIVFTTTHHELMPEAFGRNVISFLTKPFTERSVKHCLDKAAYLTKDFFPIIIDEHFSVLCQDILYLHAENKYTVFYTTDGNTISSRDSLTTWKERLKEFGFCSISRNSVINLKHYKRTFQKKAVLTNGMRLPVSRRCLQTLDNNFNSYMINRV